ncbi:MAG: hypothetical protein ACSW8D_08865, partial [Prevotella sp.]
PLTPPLGGGFLETQKKKDRNYTNCDNFCPFPFANEEKQEKACILLVFFVSLSSSCNSSWPKNIFLQRPPQDIATTAASFCHDRCKILPRPPQEKKSRLLFPFQFTLFPFSLCSFPFFTSLHSLSL